MIQNNQIFAAPMAGITDRPFRAILRECAPDITILTEMISSHSLTAVAKNCKRNFDNYATEGRVGAQIFGADPRIMADAAKIIETQGASFIDINMGCPVPKVATRAGAGAFLMRDHALAGRIMKSVVDAVKIPVSVKTRLGWDGAHQDSDELVRIAADVGVKFITIHGRTRAAGYTGAADWDKIADLSRGAKIPVIFNGDIKSSADIESVQKLGAGGAMIGRAMLGRPWLFSELTGATPPKKSDLILRHFDLTMEYYGARAGIPLFRKHAAWYSAGMTGANEFRMRVNKITDAAEMNKTLREFFLDNA